MRDRGARAVCYAFAVVVAACVVARFPPIASHTSRWLYVATCVVAGVAVFATAAIESRMKRGDVGPLWMRMQAPPRIVLAIGLSFATTLIAQTLNWSLGPVDPNFGAPAPPGIHAMWFFMFTLGFTGIGMMSAPSTILRVLGPPLSLLQRVPATIVIVAYSVVGAAIGFAFAFAVTWKPLATSLARVQAFTQEHNVAVTVAMLAITVGPVILFPSKGDD